MKQDNGDRSRQHPTDVSDSEIVESIGALMDETLPHPLPIPSRRDPRYRQRAVWWNVATWVGPMSEISEKTRIGLTIGGAAVLVTLVFGMGQFWGSWNATNRHRDETLARHETEIVELRRSLSEIQGSLRDIKNSQDGSREALNTAVRNSTYLVTEIGNIKVGLAERGITIRSGE